ncbi:MAG: putative membrane protein YdjX (TVP38/TMEM64 family) [Gammaproteobacteria bacterium]|jgi:uncharacterized membrane protein YdjX (TVP38/TMEM64 family)
MVVFVSRLIPFMSFVLMSYAAGLTPLKFRRFSLATLLGLIPISFALAHMGSEIIQTEDSDYLIIIALLTGLLTLAPFALKYFRESANSGKSSNPD